MDFRRWRLGLTKITSMIKMKACQELSTFSKSLFARIKIVVQRKHIQNRFNFPEIVRWFLSPPEENGKVSKNNSWCLMYYIKTKQNKLRNSYINKVIIIDPVCACKNVGNTVKMQRMMLNDVAKHCYYYWTMGLRFLWIHI